MGFDPSCYGTDVAEILGVDGGGRRPFPLVLDHPPSPAIVSRLEAVSPANLFAGSPAPEAALAGLWLYFGAFDQAHRIAQDIPGQDGSYWHGILHRHEPDAANAGYWFRKVGTHPLFPELRSAAAGILGSQTGSGRFVLGSRWDPFAFIDFYENARLQSPDSAAHQTVAAIALAEWQLLF